MKNESGSGLVLDRLFAISHPSLSSCVHSYRHDYISKNQVGYTKSRNTVEKYNDVFRKKNIE